MAINPSTQYSGQVEAPSSDYPYGGGKNETVVDALDGTPFEKAMLDDIFGFQQALLGQADIVPSESSETALVSQYLEALYQFMAEAKNFAINGTGVVQQRADYTLVKDAYDFGPDRFEGMATGTLVSAGTLAQTDAANIGITGFAHKFNQVTLTGTGIIFHRTRLESKDAKNFKDRKGSISCKVYHDAGAPIDYTLTVRKADAEDDFSTTTEISNDGGTSVGSTTATELKFEDISMGDCSNGIEIELKIECGAVTLKDFEQTEYQLKVGTVATPFKPEPVEKILAACQRYARFLEFNINQTVVDINASASGDYGLYHINHNMRDTPGVSDSGDFVFSNTQSAAWSSWKNNTKTSLFVRANAAGRASVGANAGAASWILLESEL